MAFRFTGQHEDSLFEAVQRYGLIPTLRTRLRDVVLLVRRLWLTRFWGMDIHPYTLVSRKALLDRTYPKGIHIGEGTAVNFDAVILTHDIVRGKHVDTVIGKYCMIGARSIIMPGLTVGDHSIIGAGAVVVKDVPPHSIVVGNPGKVIRSGIMTARWGKLIEDGAALPSDSERASSGL